ncbi:complement component C9 [Latimeria chalumnae]|nr:PREDICTED: complement component C9 [Latimeria chalumnae]|eukprot:XP_014346501.1 PREDICTED: complement component C9 [Latimeria chalumnae]
MFPVHRPATMKTVYTVVCFCYVFFSLQKPLSVSGEQNSLDNEALRRPVREADAPPPQECKISPWREWSSCDPCTKLKYRSRSIENFGQFGGMACTEPLGDSQLCETQQDCEKESIDCGDDFTCDSGRCIKKTLLCNEDNDCGDYSDEECDQAPKPPCRGTDIEQAELGRTAGNGINILGMEASINPFDNDYYHGTCDRVKDGNTNTYYRKPWNVAYLAYKTKVDKSLATEIYKDTKSIISKLFEESTANFNLGLSFKLKPTEENANVSMDGSLGYRVNKSRSLHELMEYSHQKNKKFMRVRGQIQLGEFRMRSRDPVLTSTFLDDLKHLPNIYDKGEYFKFLEDYGTHYTASGSVGGTYELIYVLNEPAMHLKVVSDEDVKNCLGYNLSFNYDNPINATLNLDLHADECDNVKKGSETNEEQSHVVDKVISLVNGGTVDFTTLLEHSLSQKKEVIDASVYINWAKSLINSPVLIKQKPSPIYSLVPVRMKDAILKKKNLVQATEDYIAEYNVCKCMPCENGGTVVLIDGECKCVCSEYYEGIACQKAVKSDIFKKDETSQDGNWGCWSAWSSCSDGIRTRTRECKDASSGGGACRGTAESINSC